MPSRLRRHDESGHLHFLTVSTFRRLQFFRHRSVRDAFVGAMRTVRETSPIRWIGYVVMPEHVHVLVLPQAFGSKRVLPISKVLHDLKGLSGKAGKEALRAYWRRNHTLGSSAMDAWATGQGDKRFWKPRGYDFNVVDERKVLEKLDYMHRNPIRRGLVNRAEQWLWSSYRFYELADESMIGMDWDGGFPIVA